MFTQPSQPRPRNTTPCFFACASATLGLATLLSGCATNVVGTATGSVGTVAAKAPQIGGLVYGGQSPIIGAAIQLYAVGTTGLAAKATPLIPSTTPQTVGQNLTSATGGFNIAGLYDLSTCNQPGTQVYIVATGGTASGNTSANGDIALVAALGSCTAIANSTTPVHITLNEANTVAAAYALAPFASSLANIGATFSNGNPPSGLVNAFATANLLSPYATGYPGSGSLAAGVTVPVAELNTIADILATCVNSNGGTSGDGSNCGTLFAATGVTTNTFDAALQFAKRPGSPAITALYRQVPGISAPFQPTLALTSAPNDFTVALTYAGNSGDLATPFGIAIDSAGNAFVTNESGTSIERFSPTGTPTRVAATGLIGAQGIALDTSNNIWIANTAGNSVIEIPSNLGAAAAPITAGGINAPTALAIDSQNNIWVANLNGDSVTELSNAGAPLNGSPLTAGGNITVPTAIAIGKSASGGAVYVASGSGSLVKLNQATGAYLTADNDGTLQGPSAIATDPVSGYLVASGYTTGTSVGGALSEFSADAAATGSPVASVTSAPAGVADDGASIWVANSTTSGGLSQFTYGSSAAASPASGYGTLNTPVGVAVDASGSVWTANSGSNTVSRFIGLSTPVATPIAVNVGP